MSAALRIVEALDRGDHRDERVISFVAALLRPIFNPELAWRGWPGHRV